MKKYEEYLVRVNYKNGDTEDINFKGINTSSYQEMLQVYRDVKVEHEKDYKVDTIEFVGKSCEGELNIFFTKKVKITTDSELNKDCREVVQEINDKIELLEDQFQYHNNMLGKYDKQRDTLLHMIENLNNDNFESEEYENNYRLSLLSQLESVLHQRRYNKLQLIDLGNIRTEFKKINLNGFLKDRKEFTLGSQEYRDVVEKEIYYKDEKEKNILIDKYSKEFDKYVVDNANQLLYFYSKVGVKNSNSQKQNKLNKKLNKNSNRMVG